MLEFKVAVANMRYFTRSKFSRSLVHRKIDDLTWQVVLKLEYLYTFMKGVSIRLLSLNKVEEISKTTIIQCTFIRKNSYGFIVFVKCLCLMTYSFDKLLIFFWVTLVDIFCLKLESKSYCTYVHIPNKR